MLFQNSIKFKFEPIEIWKISKYSIRLPDKCLKKAPSRLALPAIDQDTEIHLT